jgi:hypothetical protein
MPIGARRRFLFLLSLLFLLAPREARATDVEMGAAAGATTFASTWRGDLAAGTTLRAGVRFGRVVAGDFQIWESYATVNQRLDTGLSIGVTGFLPLPATKPFARLFVLHQHEEALVSVANAPAGVLFGIGAGIRHRAGGGLSLGAEIPIRRSEDKRLAWVFVAEATGIYFPDATLGPTAYAGIDLGVGFDYLVR